MRDDDTTGARQTSDFATAMDSAQFRTGSSVTREGDETPHFRVLAQGFAQGVRTVAGGGQQTVAVYIPGDILDAKSLFLGHSSLSIIDLTPLRVVQTSFARMHVLMLDRPSLTNRVAKACASGHLILEAWAGGLGRRSADQHLAHFFCELYSRMKRAKLAAQDGCSCPLTQPDLANVLGLSPVHVNRVIQRLRAQGLIEFKGGRLTVLDWTELVRVADFDGNYLDVSEPLQSLIGHA